MTFATDYSRTRGPNAVRRFNTGTLRLVAALTVGVAAAGAETGPVVTNSPAALAKTEFDARQVAYQRDSTNAEVAWQFARACFDWAEFATNDTQRADLAQLGIRASRELIARSSNSVQGQYYLGMNLGQLARTRSLGALRLVGQMEAAFKTARTLDEKFDFAGPDRNLGLLYLDAPSGISVGDPRKARTHLQRAVELAPEFPDNRLNLAEAHIRWNEFEAARKEVGALDAVLSQARNQFAGDAWAGAWLDWRRRLEKLHAQLQRPVKKAASPKGTP
jgi:tetratricopeptide (TPR) repeat protein